MAKSLREVTYDRAKFGTLAAANAEDGIAANEWQAVYCVYKIVKANDQLRV